LLIHALKLPVECKYSLNTMASLDGLEARARFVRKQSMNFACQIFMDLRAPLSSDLHLKLVRRLHRIPFIKGAFLDRIDLLTYRPPDPASNWSNPDEEVKFISLPMNTLAGDQRLQSCHITQALAFPDCWHRGL